jgi:hypothetical protein
MRFDGNGQKYMSLRLSGKQVTGLVVILAMCGLAEGQARRTTTRGRAKVRAVAPSNSASHVSAELSEGKVSPVLSKPGDTFVVKLQDDVKGNGQVVLKKGTALTGIIRNVKQNEASSTAKSTVEIEWLAPVAEGKTPPSLSIAMQSVTQQPLQGRNSSDATSNFLTGKVSTAVASTSTAPAISPVSLASGQSNRALLSMPSVVAVDKKTSAAIADEAGASSSAQLFKVGGGHLVAADGSLQSVDIFSHLNNDTVITSSNKNFEISTGAQIQMLVGVIRK